MHSVLLAFQLGKRFTTLQHIAAPRFPRNEVTFDREIKDSPSLVAADKLQSNFDCIDLCQIDSHGIGTRVPYSARTAKFTNGLSCLATTK